MESYHLNEDALADEKTTEDLEELTAPSTTEADSEELTTPSTTEDTIDLELTTTNKNNDQHNQ